MSLLHAEAGHPPCFPLQAPMGQNCLQPRHPQHSQKRITMERTVVESPAETWPCCRLQVTSPRLKVAHQRQRVSDPPAVQVPGSGNPTCECTGLRTSLGHPHQAPLTRSSHQTPSSQTYPSHLFCVFLPTPISRIPRIIDMKNLFRSVRLER